MQSTAAAEKTILYVDYSADNAEVVKYFLHQSGYRVETCETGEAGLDLARQRDDFALIMTEYRLPDMNGADFCREFRKINRRIPLMFFTASVQKWEREKGLASGAQAYLIKPDDLDKIAETVDTLIGRNH
ncbi:MAG TPA: response regulator [Pyrinomonadaceae bacterium]|nr:response regulator [Pyrinomonadaceae bacterium]